MGRARTRARPPAGAAPARRRRQHERPGGPPRRRRRRGAAGDPARPVAGVLARGPAARPAGRRQPGRGARPLPPVRRADARGARPVAVARPARGGRRDPPGPPGPPRLTPRAPLESGGWTRPREPRRSDPLEELLVGPRPDGTSGRRTSGSRASRATRRATSASRSSEVFVGQSQKMPHGRVFGGQVLAQAVVAAGRTVAGVGRRRASADPLPARLLRPAGRRQPPDPVRRGPDPRRPLVLDPSGPGDPVRRADPVDDRLVPGAGRRPGPPGVDAGRPGPGQPARGGRVELDGLVPRGYLRAAAGGPAARGGPDQPPRRAASSPPGRASGCAPSGRCPTTRCSTPPCSRMRRTTRCSNR